MEPDPPHPLLLARLLRGVESAMVVHPVRVVVVDDLVERPELHAIGLEMPQRRLELQHRRLVVAAVRAALPEELHPLAVSVAQREADPSLGASVTVLGRDLEQRHAAVDRLTHELDGRLLAGFGKSARSESEDARCGTGASDGAVLKGEMGLWHRRAGGRSFRGGAAVRGHRVVRAA